MPAKRWERWLPPFTVISKTALAFATALLASAATPAPVTWQNVTLGQPASALRAVLGDPLRIVAFEKDDTRVARYWLAGANSTYLLVIERRGYVEGFDIFTDTAPSDVLANVSPDPSGVRLGDTMDSVRATHPGFREDQDRDGNATLVGKVSASAGAAYGFENGRVFRIHWSTAVSEEQPNLAPITVPAGDSSATAISDMQNNESDGVAWEYRYLAFHPCAENAHWQITKQLLVREGGRAYDVLHVACQGTSDERDYFFETSNYFGKP